MNRKILSLRTLSNRRVLCAVLVAALSFTVNGLIALHNGVPQPRVQDEFSYLLAGDTFAHGRLTNPTPPFPEHFETPHVLLRPTYMSKYPPGQGLFLATGQLLDGQPIVGVWISSALATAAVYWMLLGFVDPIWALIGGIVTAIHPQLLAWSQVYWGGSVAVLGGALLLGAWGRLMLKARPSGSAMLTAGGPALNEIWLAIGLVVLANSRPYEGLVLSIPLLTALLLNHRPPLKPIAAAAAVLLIAGGWMCYYNTRITGHPLRLPFMEYTAQYDIYPKFWFQPTRPPPLYSSPDIAAIHTQFERGDYDELQTLGGVLRISAGRLWSLISMHARPWVLLVPLTLALTQRRLKWIWITLAVFVLGLWAETWFLPHYAAPAMPILLLLIVAGWQQLWSWKSSAGRILAVATLCGFLATAVAWAAAPLPVDALRFSRAELFASYPQLRNGRHLIFVKYEPGHLLHDEWVYNQADLEHADIIWARAMGAVADGPVMRYFPDRQVWILRIGETQLRFDRY